MRGNSLSLMWVAALGALLVANFALSVTGVHVSPGPKGLVLGWSAAFWLSLCFIIRPQCRWARRVLAAGNGLLLLSVIGVTGALLSYYTVRVSPFPLADTVLYRADLTIGLDWLAVYRSYAGFSPVHLLANRLYLTIFDTPYVIVIGLAAAGRDDKLLTFIGAFAIGLLLTILVSFFLPAASPVIHFFGSSPPYVPTTGTGYYPVLTELRSQRIMHVASHELFGLLNLPQLPRGQRSPFRLGGMVATVPSVAGARRERGNAGRHSSGRLALLC